MSNIRKQIELAEERWQANSTVRERCRDELCKYKKGNSPDWQQIDEKSRIARRLERLGEFDAAEAVVDQEIPNFDPYERILGANQLTGVEFFERGLIAARAVVRIEIRGSDGRLLGYGSGVMISPKLLMTNNHVLSSHQDAGSSIAQFEYLTGADGVAREPLPFWLDPDSFFVTNEHLDFTIVAVSENNEEGVPVSSRGWCPLIAGSGKAIVGERVNLIQHPGGERMQIAVRENTIVAVIEDFLQYQADTRPGSSGSPVFNEQWEMAALHHSGVPKRDGSGRILMRDGNPWTGRDEDVDRIDWESNEGVRVSRIVSHVNSLALTQFQNTLWNGAFQPPPPLTLWDLFDGTAAGDGGESASGVPDQSMHTVSPLSTDENDSASWLFKLSFGPFNTCNPTNSRKGRQLQAKDAVRQLSGQSPKRPSRSPSLVRDDRSATPDKLAKQLFEQFRHDGPYYDAEADSNAAEKYWESIAWDSPAASLFSQLGVLLEETHKPRLSYQRARHQFLYPSIDLHEDGMLHNVYSGNILNPKEAIARELTSVLARAEALGFEASTLDAKNILERDDFWESLEAEAAAPFNCEHVVPQSWFEKRQPMKADLHHLFACEPGCNSFRSNIPYWQFDPTDEAERDLCGRREGNKFEPEHGKGAVARATFYFLLRYPGEVGDRRTELTKSRLGILLDWHQSDKVGAYEKHRNWLSEKAQGNRNPFIDRPEAASSALLSLGFGSR